MFVGVVDPASTRALRRAVLRPHTAADGPLPGDDLPGVVHLGAFDDDGTVLGTCFVFPEDCRWLADGAGAWHLRQMATAPGRQGQGIGGAVLQTAVAVVRDAGAPLIWCHARAEAEGFYARHGFRARGKLFLDGEHPIPHRRMWRELSTVPASS